MKTMEIKTRINRVDMIFLSMMNSGNDNAATDMIKAMAVPGGTPWSVSAKATGTMAAEQAYNGIPAITVSGNLYQLLSAMKELSHLSGT